MHVVCNYPQRILEIQMYTQKCNIHCSITREMVFSFYFCGMCYSTLFNNIFYPYLKQHLLYTDKLTELIEAAY